MKEERTRFWSSPQLDGLELLWGQFRKHRYRPHVHEGYVLGVVTEGVEKYRCRREDHYVGPGDIIIINPDSLHDGEAGAEGGWRYRVMYPREPALGRIGAQLGLRESEPPRFSMNVIRDPALARGLVSLHRLLEGPACRFQVQDLWTRTIERLVRLHADRPPPEPDRKMERGAVARVRDYLAGNLARGVTLDEAAAVAGLSPCYLQRVFKQQTGLSPHAFLTCMRVRRAKRLLSLGQPIAEVAAAAGFVDQAHLTKRFKTVFGFTPGQYRRALSQDRTRPGPNR